MAELLDAQIAYDPIEDDPRHRAAFREVNERVRSRYGGEAGRMGVLREMWEYKKRILRLEYGIEWHSPADLNPCVLFD